jgi:hypothetical protein
MKIMLCNWQMLLAFVAMPPKLSSCANNAGSDWVEATPASAGARATVHISRTVRHLDPEGGLFVIRDVDGTQYNPSNLPGGFQVDGMAVEAQARHRDEIATIGMVGPVVELQRISRHAGDGAPNIAPPGGACS